MLKELIGYQIEYLDDEKFIVSKNGEKNKWQILGGLDFGFVHPTAFSILAINKEDRICYVFDGNESEEHKAKQKYLGVKTNGITTSIY